MPRPRDFVQVDVFSATAYRGNPLAVVLDAEGMTTEEMQTFARWTNLSETTFLLPPTRPEADYRVRIFTPSTELPFAGHPTLGSAHAWLGAGGVAHGVDVVVQECGAGLLRVHRDGDRLAFEAPPTVRSGPVEPDVLARVVAVLGVTPEQVVAHQWVVNGPQWLAVRLGTAAEVLALEPDPAGLGDLFVGVFGDRPRGSSHAYEIRAFAPGAGVVEDPVTGSLNASVAQWLVREGLAPAARYRVSQGARVHREGDVHVSVVDGAVRIGGRSTTCVRGTVEV